MNRGRYSYQSRLKMDIFAIQFYENACGIYKMCTILYQTFHCEVIKY